MIKCNICDKEFKNKKSMTNHRRWHDLPEYKEFQENVRENISISNEGSKNGMWKGIESGYFSIHNWVNRHLIKQRKCSNCGKEGTTEWSSLTHEYKRIKEEYVELCRSCHMKYDYKKGFRASRKDYHLTEEHKKKISLTLRNHYRKKEVIES